MCSQRGIFKITPQQMKVLNSARGQMCSLSSQHTDVLQLTLIIGSMCKNTDVPEIYLVFNQ